MDPEVGRLWCAVVSYERFVVVEQATQNWSTLDPLMAEVRDGAGRLRWTKIPGACRR